MTIKSLSELHIPTTTEAVVLYAKEPTEENLGVLANIVIRNSETNENGGTQAAMSIWGARGFCSAIKALVDQGTTPGSDALKAIHKGWFEADWRRRAWMTSDEGKAKLARWTAERTKAARDKITADVEAG